MRSIPRQCTLLPTCCAPACSCARARRRGGTPIICRDKSDAALYSWHKVPRDLDAVVILAGGRGSASIAFSNAPLIRQLTAPSLRSQQAHWVVRGVDPCVLGCTSSNSGKNGTLRDWRMFPWSTQAGRGRMAACTLGCDGAWTPAWPCSDARVCTLVDRPTATSAWSFRARHGEGFSAAPDAGALT